MYIGLVKISTQDHNTEIFCLSGIYSLYCRQESALPIIVQYGEMHPSLTQKIHVACHYYSNMWFDVEDRDAFILWHTELDKGHNREFPIGASTKWLITSFLTNMDLP